MNFTPYLSFNGNCQEAIETYAGIFDAKIDELRRFRDEPSCANMPGEVQDLVMYARLSVGDAVLMASDTMGENYQLPQGIHVSVGFATLEAAGKAFDGLSEKGDVMMPLSKTFFSEGFGMIRDRFGVLWMVNVRNPESQYY